MDAVKYLKEKERMFREDCAIGVNFFSPKTSFEERVKIVEEWSKSHPEKTRLNDLKEKYPKAKLDSNGIPVACATALGYCNVCCGNCEKCWDEPLEDKER